ncbi:GTP-binding protein [Streptomyces sp. NPDC048172]|uniref:GTP-binding protein n=1 Tax=Streptomyces sp. NPDC048172 TaxID=3365505 RepID=UPI0037223FA8
MSTPARTLNLGILAHVDAGKTSLTERLLHTAGVRDEIGSVDAGSTLTDSLALERRRGITVKSAVASFEAGGVTVNLIDTPGHPDFIAEVERVLSVLDGAVLVVSAVEGVQPQTRVLMRTLRRLRLPTLLFVNKIDRAGAREDAVLRGIAAKLTDASLAMGAVRAPGTRGARAVPYEDTDPGFVSRMAAVLAEHDEELLAAYVEDERSLSPVRLRAALVEQTRRALVHPVFPGSAITGAGIGELVAGIAGLLPATEVAGAAAGAPSGTVFKVARGPAGEKSAYVRMTAGTVRVRDRLRLPDGTEEKVTGIEVFERGSVLPRPEVGAGRIGILRGLRGVRVGDRLGDRVDARVGARPLESEDRDTDRHFAAPTLESVVVPRRPDERGALHTALTQLAEQDPLIGLRLDERRGETRVSLYGEVQKEVIAETLAAEFGVEADFRETTTLHIERPAGTGEAVEVLHAGANPFLATVGLRVAPAPVGSGVGFRLEIELGSLPYAFVRAVEETVRATLGQGLHGWEVTDCVVTLTRSGYLARQSHAHGTFDKSMSSTAGDFRNLTPLVLMEALRRAGTRVCEPVHHFRLDLPAEAYGAVLPVLSRLRAVPRTSVTYGDTYAVEGDIPAASVHGLERELPSLTSGEGVLETVLDRYEPVRGSGSGSGSDTAPPSRPRTDSDPLDREEYLLRVDRRVDVLSGRSPGPAGGAR